MNRTEAIEWQARLFPLRGWTTKDKPGDAEPDTLVTLYHWGHAPTLPEICMSLLSSCDGRADPWETGWLSSVRDMLTARSKTWEQLNNVFDIAVYLMVGEAIREATEELESRSKTKA